VVEGNSHCIMMEEMGTIDDGVIVRGVYTEVHRVKRENRGRVAM